MLPPHCIALGLLGFEKFQLNCIFHSPDISSHCWASAPAVVIPGRAEEVIWTVQGDGAALFMIRLMTLPGLVRACAGFS